MSSASEETISGVIEYLDDVDDDAEEDEKRKITYSISSYGADYTADSIVKRLNNGAFYVPQFQRSYVWTRPQASRFIESLLLGLPVPGVFLAKEEETNKHLVIDGQQRLKSLQFFYQGIFGQSKFSLQKVDERWNGKSIDDLHETDRLRLDDSIIHCTIFKQNRPEGDDTSFHDVFDRLNTGAVKLYPQEIRNYVDHGNLTKLLNACNKIKAWRDIFGKESVRLKDQELILRFFAFYLNEGYQRPMREFLNRFSHKNRKLSDEQYRAMFGLFENTVNTVGNALGEKAFRPIKNLNAAVFEAVMIGLARRLETENASDPVEDAIKRIYNELVKNQEFLEACSQHSSDEKNIRKRQDLAIRAFADA